MRHDGGPKTCRIHDLLRNLLISKAEQDLFFMIDASRHTPPSLNLRRLAILYNESKSECSYLNQPKPRLRSLLCFSKLEQNVVVRLLNGSATLLRVLDLSGVKDYSTRSIDLPKEIGELVHLRYLNLENTGIKSLPLTMGKLTNLQILDLNGNQIKYMTTGISYMYKLRHLYSDFIKMHWYYRLDSLVTLQTLELHSGKWIENGLSIFGFPSKLLHSSYDGDTMLCSVQGFPWLESLKLSKLDGLTEWTIEKGAMRTLPNLVIDGCGKLEKLPMGLIYLTTLRELYLGGISGNLKDCVGENVGKDWHKIQHVPYVMRKGV